MLIVGAGLTGLSAAVFLGAHGVLPIVVERHAEILRHPRARGINPRTVEVFRQVGLESQLRANAAMGLVATESADQMMRAETLASPTYTMESLAPGEINGLSPCSWCAIDQDKLETVLAARATELGADLRFGTVLRSLNQTANGVAATVADQAGNEYSIDADYVIGADGYRSAVRTALGIEVDGIGVLAETLTAVFDADLEPVLAGRRIGMAYLDVPSEPTVIFPHDGKRSWVFGMPLPPGESAAEYTEDRCVEMIRAAVGVPDLDLTLQVQLPATGAKLLSFPVGAQVAQRFALGRVFLAGDAARINPPTGAFGGSTGIQDAHNLAWKLAEVLHGRAAPELLATYETERRAVAEFTVEQAMARMVTRAGDPAEAMEKADVVEVDGIVIYPYWSIVYGYRYRSSAVLADDESDDGAPALLTGELDGIPGTRAPHAVLARNGRELSTLDLYGHGLVLLAGPAASWAEDLAIPAEAGLPLSVHRVGTTLTDPTGTWAQRHGVKDDGAVLVRPDGFVAWRTTTTPPQPAEELTRALRGLAHR